MRVDVDVADAKRPADPARRQVLGFDEPVDRHRRHPHQVRHFLHRQETRFRKRLRHVAHPSPPLWGGSVGPRGLCCQVWRLAPAVAGGAYGRSRGPSTPARSASRTGRYAAGGRLLATVTTSTGRPRWAASAGPGASRSAKAIVSSPAAMAAIAKTPSATASVGRPTAKSHSSPAVSSPSSQSWCPSVTTATPSCHHRERPYR